VKQQNDMESRMDVSCVILRIRKGVVYRTFQKNGRKGFKKIEIFALSCIIYLKDLHYSTLAKKTAKQFSFLGV